MKKARFIKYVLLISSIIILLLATTAVIVINYFPKDKILSLITDRAEKILNRTVVIKEINYGLQGIIVNNISIYNKLYPDNNIPESGLLASAVNANIQFSLLPLFQKKFIINRIVLNDFKIIIRYENNKFNLYDLIQDLKSSESSDIETKISSIRFKNAEISLREPPDILKPLEGRYVFNGILDLLSNNQFSIFNCDVILPEDRGRIQSDNVGIKIFENNFEVTGDYWLQKCSLMWVYKWTTDLSLPYTDFTGKITKLRITKDLVDGYADGRSTLTNSQIVKADGQCKVDMANETLSLLNINGNIEKSKFFINEIKLYYKDDAKEILVKFNITDVDSNVGDLKGILTFLPINFLKNIYGNVSGFLSYGNNLFNGTINLNNVSYKSGDKEILRINSEISINDNNIYNKEIPVFIDNQPCKLSISVSGKNFEKIILNLYAKEFNYLFDKEKSIENNFSSYKIHPDKIRSDISGRIDIENLKVDKYAFSDVAVVYSFRDGKLILSQAGGKFMGGSINGNGNIDISGNEPNINISANFNDIKVQNIANLNEELSGRFFGIAEGYVNLGFGITKDADIFDSLKGRIEFNIDKGKLVNTGMQKGLGIWLAELKYKLSNLEFNKIYGNLGLEGNNCNVNSVLFSASDIRLKVDGYFKPFNENKKMPGDLKIDLEFNDFFIQDIPNPAQLIAKLLKLPFMKKKSGWYTMPFRDKGDDITDSKNIKPL